jgi:hypothetical protein
VRYVTILVHDSETITGDHRRIDKDNVTVREPRLKVGCGCCSIVLRTDLKEADTLFVQVG